MDAASGSRAPERPAAEDVEPVLRISGLSYAYGKTKALEDVTFAIRPGRVTALLGPNGAGKTTLFSLVTGLFDSRRGDIQIAGHRLRKARSRALAALGIVFQAQTLDLDLTVTQNLRYFPAPPGLPGRPDSQRPAGLPAPNGPRRVTALPGPTGAGKTTLFSLVTGLFDSRRGDIQIAGHRLRKARSRALAALGIVFQAQTLDLDLTVTQNLRYFAALRGLPGRAARRRIDELLAEIGLSDKATAKVRTLSGGQRRRVEVAQPGRASCRERVCQYG